MKDKFGRDINRNDIVLLADENDLTFAVVNARPTMDANMVYATANGLNYMYASDNVIKIEELPIDVRDTLRGELKQFEWLSADSPIKFQDDDSFFEYTCRYLRYRFPYLSLEVCTLLLVKLNSTDTEFYDFLWEKFCENEESITGRKTIDAVINISTNR